MQSPLIEVGELASSIGNPNILILDARWLLEDEQWGKKVFLAGHLPGALYVNLNTQLSRRPTNAIEGRRPAPLPVQWQDTIRSWGVTGDTSVVVYDDAAGSMAAARAWVLLRWAGVRQVRVLNGGFKAWRGSVESGGALPRSPSTFQARWQSEWLTDTGNVLSAIHKGTSAVVDARLPAEFSGEMHERDPIGGHIPTAVNLPHVKLAGADGRLLQPAQLRQVMRGHGADDEDVIASCGSGVWASQILLAREVAGLPPGRLFAGSWSAWCADPDLPIARR